MSMRERHCEAEGRSNPGAQVRCSWIATAALPPRDDGRRAALLFTNSVKNHGCLPVSLRRNYTPKRLANTLAPDNVLILRAKPRSGGAFRHAKCTVLRLIAK